MKIIVSKYSGFCYGVDRALKITNKVLSENRLADGKNIYMLGELVHNEKVVQKIKRQNIKLVKDIEKIPEGSLVILSAHGHSPRVYQKAKKMRLEIFDATCPMVRKAHILGKMLAKQGYFIIIIGDKEHQEVKAIFDQIKSVTDKIKIIENVQQAKNIILPSKINKIGIISQTTQPLENFSQISGELSIHVDELRVFNTICDATRFRQSAAKELAKNVDLMIIVGSSHSANTKRLTQICKRIVETYQVNSAKELDKNWFKDKKIVGISAGASTPNWIIDEVIKSIQ